MPENIFLDKWHPYFWILLSKKRATGEIFVPIQEQDDKR